MHYTEVQEEGKDGVNTGSTRITGRQLSRYIIAISYSVPRGLQHFLFF